ncbi:MAG: hypothetical protein EOO11_19520 [Chitinophagaceae bacterium]|nr:MAG: hypothetical protein EOO11_19520 [Chitinophagaceae bacterium]
MKIRIQGNSIRYRLKEPEVRRFSETGLIEETMQLGGGAALRFRLELGPGAEVSVEHRVNTVTVRVPQALGQEWTGTERVGFDAEVGLDADARLKVLVEKDWACLDGSEEENIGSYPNPMTEC